MAVVFAYLFVDLFDETPSTLIALGPIAAASLRPDGTVPRLRGALIADSGAAMIGAAVGTSTTTSYIESASGINSGGPHRSHRGDRRHALPPGAVRGTARRIDPRLRHGAGALFNVACLMVRSLTEVAWDDITEAAPAVVTAITMPFTFSIAEGIAFGFISYCAIKIATGRYRDVHPAVGTLAAPFVIKYVVIG